MTLIGNLIKLPLLICAYCVMWTMQRIFGEHRLNRWTGYIPPSALVTEWDMTQFGALERKRKIQC